jgi:hypothetical protein
LLSEAKSTGLIIEHDGELKLSENGDKLLVAMANKGIVSKPRGWIRSLEEHKIEAESPGKIYLPENVPCGNKK